MKVYLAKSNRSDPEHYIYTRAALLKQGMEVLEYKGGQYSDHDMLSCDLMIVVPEAPTNPVVLGKGLYLQADSFLKRNRPTYIVTYVSGIYGEVRVVPMKKESLSIRDNNDWTKYGTYKLNHETDLRIQAILPVQKEMEIYL